MALFGARKMKVAINSLKIWAQTFIVSPCLKGPNQKLIFVIVFQPMRQLEFLVIFSQVPKMQISATFVNNCHYSVKQWHTLILLQTRGYIMIKWVQFYPLHPPKWCPCWLWKKLPLEFMQIRKSSDHLACTAYFLRFIAFQR